MSINLKEIIGIKVVIIRDKAAADGLSKNVITVATVGGILDTAYAVLTITEGSAFFCNNQSQSTKVRIENLFNPAMVEISDSVVEPIVMEVTLVDTDITQTIELDFVTPEVQSIEKLATVWGEWWASQKGTYARFIASTDYSKYGELSTYIDNQIQINYKDIFYSNVVEIPSNDILASKQTISNRSSTTQTETLTWSKNTTNSFVWSVTESIKTAAKLSFSVGIPLIAESKIEASIELSLSSTQETTSTKTETWQVSMPVTVPSGKEIVCTSVITQNAASMDFVVSSEIVKYVAVWLEDQWNGHHLYFARIDKVFNEIIDNNLISTYGYKVIDGVGVSTTAKGITTGV